MAITILSEVQQDDFGCFYIYYYYAVFCDFVKFTLLFFYSIISIMPNPWLLREPRPAFKAMERYGFGMFSS